MSVVFILTSHAVLGDTGRSTGLWLEEFLVPYYAVKDAGQPTLLATPKGGHAPIDPASVEALKDSEVYARFAKDAQLHQALESTTELSSLSPAAIAAAIYPGGHGPLWDLRHDQASIRLIESLLGAGKPVATICHAGCALLEVKKVDGSPLVKGLNVTAFSDSEEAAVAMVEHVPYLVETDLKALGALYTKASDWTEHSVQDGLVITGQNPASSAAVAQKVLAQISKK
ncbi:MULTISPECIES: type 1 glutamine amidotransferase domain-containing protein [unclassified Pseudomonas]|uniref:type 1 glutamine amidotransferase domain-containing protein n=1 Tax=unclassified Pseudomonas TaxID=196821 RepID=UPI000838EAF1|nr:MULTISPECIES: type 1 glutamine amidotransferase domain-containing protein [unclassified Pseudomonas]QIH08694.1 type 1 glutamine amidotransferase domain-containing protein [Pseudomonas sp. BIOMIG1BAC]